MPTPRPRPLTALLTAPLLLAACGSGTSDKDAITKIIQDGGKDPASICAHLAAAPLNQLGGLDACRRTAKAGDDGKDAVSIKALQIKGKNARAQIVGARGAQTITFAEQDGHWVVIRTS